MELTPRDVEILRLVQRHRFLRSHQLSALIGGSRQQLLRRLQSLYHHGFVERPLSQIDYYQRGGSQSMVYGLSNRGAAHLSRADGHSVPRLDWNARNRHTTRLFLEHALMISEIIVALELAACSIPGVRILHHDETPKWKIPMRGSALVTVIPDALFSIEHNDTSILFALEADRGTMPVQSANRLRSSIARKLTAYEASWRGNIFRQRFGASRVQVLTITTSTARLASITEHARSHVSAAGLFHFATIAQLTAAPTQFLASLVDCKTPAPAQTMFEFAELPAT
jgi:hypothetical protein